MKEGVKDIEYIIIKYLIFMSLIKFLKSLFGGKKAEAEMPIKINPEYVKHKTFPPLENKVEEGEVALNRQVDELAVVKEEVKVEVAPVVEEVKVEVAPVVEEVKPAKKVEPTVKDIKAKSSKTEDTTKEQSKPTKSKPKNKPKKDSK